jgi:hypothetical protein
MVKREAHALGERFLEMFDHGIRFAAVWTFEIGKLA